MLEKWSTKVDKQIIVDKTTKATTAQQNRTPAQNTTLITQENKFMAHGHGDAHD